MAARGTPGRLESRLLVCAASIGLNALLWYGLSVGANQVSAPKSLPELVVERVTIEKPNPKAPDKVVMRTVIIPPRPPAERTPVKQPTPPPTSEGAHNQAVTAKPSGPTPPDPGFTALPGGQAKLGAPTSGQAPGQAVQNPIAAPIATPAPNPEVKRTDPAAVAPAPPAVVAPKKEDPAPPPSPPPPPPPPPPAPVGPTQDAIPSNQVNPEIPESLKSQTFKSFVRVKVSISASGSFEVTLRTSSGNPDIDKLVLAALNKWSWKPALKNGQAVDSVQLFRFDFSVE